MKTLSLVALSTALALGSPLAARAATVQATVSALSCSSLAAASGATSITFSGDFGGAGYLNITNVNMFGLPFTQQAMIESVDATVNNSLRFRLHTMLTGGTIYLEIFNGTSRGLLSSSPGDDSGIQLNCTAKIDRS